MSKVFMRSLAAGGLVAALCAGAQSDVEVVGSQGPSSSATPYVVPTATGVRTVSILTVGDTVNSKPDGVTPYRMIGIPDGMGAYDNGDGTFTLLVNHELGNTSGTVRAHGSVGATVSAWVVDRKTLQVVSGQDLIRSVASWNAATQVWTTGTVAYARFCSGDLPPVSAYFNSATGLGARERIYMSGEENGTAGRGWAHIASGPNAGFSFEIPRFGKDSWENLIACPAEQDKTIVACDDDTTPGQIYFYIGTKQATGNEIKRAGLTNGKLWGVIANGTRTEDRTTGIGLSKGVPGAFTLADLGDHSAIGVVTETVADAANVTEWLRPEDGAWDANDPRTFYFVTTDRFDNVKNSTGSTVGRSRLWRLRFTDIANPEQGGQVTMMLDGTEPQQMFDNLCVDALGNVLLTEDVGGNAHNGQTWHLDVTTGALTAIAGHDVARFGNLTTPATLPFSNDEEASGIFDASEFLGPGWFILCTQAHGGTSPGTELVENGQIMALFNPTSVVAPAFTAAASASTTTPVVGQAVTFSATADASSDGSITYAWTFGDGSNAAGPTVTHAYSAPGVYTATVTATHVPTGRTATSTVNVAVSRPMGVPSVSIALNFAKANKDSVVVTGALPIDAGFDPVGKQVVVDVGGVSRTFTLDAKGKGTAAGASIRMSIRRVNNSVVTQRAQFVVTIKGDLADSFTDEGLADETNAGEAVIVPVSLTFAGRTSQFSIELIYAAKAGKKGTAR